MRQAFCYPKRVIVDMGDGEYGLGDHKFTTIDGRYSVHIDGECSEHLWDENQVAFLDDVGGEVN